MTKSTDRLRNAFITRKTISLFWQAILQSKSKMFFTYLGHGTSFIISAVYIPLLIAYAIQAIINHQFNLIDGYCLKIMIAAVAFGAFQALGTWAFDRNGVIGGAYLDRTIFANYLSKDYEFFGSNFVGALGSQVHQLKNAYFAYQLIFLFDGPRVVVTIIASLIVIYIHSPLLALITFGFILASASFVLLFSRFRLKFRQAVAVASSDISGVVGDALSHGSTVKSFASSDYEQGRLESKLKVWSKAQLRSWDLFSPANFGRNIFIYAAIAVLIAVSAHLYQRGVITVAIVTLVQFYVIRLLNTMLELGDVIKQYDQLMSDSYQPVATMLVPTTLHDIETPQPLKASDRMTIRFNTISYHYPDARKSQQAVESFSLTIAAGEKVGLVGYSGSGKTTLTKLLLRFMDVSAGGIEINGIDIRKLSQDDVRSTISYVPQEPLLFHRSIRDNILYGRPNANDKQLVHAAKLAYAEDFISDLPDGYDTLVGERGVKLSGGQRQRIAIARALLKDAPILVLDEATSALDSASEQYIQKALWELMVDRTALVIAHRLSTIQKMDRIIVMDKGKILQQGTHQELLTTKRGIYAKLWAHQSGGYLAKSEDDK